MRIQFKKGKQREFLRLVLERSRCPSLRALRQFGFDVGYQTLKSYYAENRTLPLSLFEDLCTLAGIDTKKILSKSDFQGDQEPNGFLHQKFHFMVLDKKKLKFKMIEDSWGQVKGGKK